MKYAPFLSIVLLGVSCCLPALEWQKAGAPNDIMFGARALFLGWSGLFVGIFAWCANPLWAVSLCFALLRKPKITAALAAIAFLVALTTFTAIGRELPGDEGGVTKTTIIRMLPGCYVWMASSFATIVTALLPASS